MSKDSAKGITAQNDGFGTRIGYILSTLGMSVGVGAIWKFPMLSARWGGGAFVLAFVIITIICVIPAGFAESALGRKYRMSSVGIFGKLFGKKRSAFGWLMGITPWGLMCYYPIIMALVVMYIWSAATGKHFASSAKVAAAYYEQMNDSRVATYIIVCAIIIGTALISLRGIQAGVEKACKIMLPMMFVFLLVIIVRVCTLPGIAKGIEWYIHPDWSQFATPGLWAAAAGMALFAVGLGPGYLLTYGRYLDDNADLATDFITVNVTQLLICMMCGFCTIPVVILYGLDPLAGKGLIFQSLPLIFDELPGGMLWFLLFMLAMFFAGLSTTLSLVEVPTVCLMDSFKLSRTKAVWLVTIVCCLGAIPCVWSDTFFAFFDNMISNVFYCIDAAGVALILAWIVGARKIREEWYNPTSAIKWGSWVDIAYKFVAVPAFLYFAITAVISLGQLF